MKDPAFLFYSKDFYEGTRMMLPEERACYIDLLIYQHQHGAIPNDLKRVLMYCSGVDEATLQATLQAKFKQTASGWVNSRLEKAILERENYKNQQSLSGKIGQFWKKAYKLLSKSDVTALKKAVTNDLIINFLNECDIKDESTLKGSLQGLLKRCLSNKAIVNAIVNTDEDIEKGGVGEKTELPEIENFDELNFEHVWNLFGKKGNRKTSERKWNGLPKKAKQLAVVHIPQYVDNTPDLQYRQNFETYINKETWNDIIIPKNGANQSFSKNGNAGLTDEEVIATVECGLGLAAAAEDRKWT